MKDNIRVEIVLLDSQIFTDAIIDSLAGSLSANFHKLIDEKSAEVMALMGHLAKK